MPVHVAAGSRMAALLTCTSLSLSSAFAPPPTCAAAAQTGVRGLWTPRSLALRARAVRWGGAFPLDSWMRREIIDVHASAPRAAASCRVDDPQGDWPNQLQELLEACKAAFDPVNGRVEARENQLAGIVMRLDELTADQLGVPQADMLADMPPAAILYTEIAAGDKYTMCIFALPAGAKLPLHDHPDMTVFSKVLWGKMQVSAYDRAPVTSEEREGRPGATALENARGMPGQGLMSWMKKSAPSAPPLEPFPVIRRKEGEVWTSESGVQLTLASTCNIHEFTALSPCCVVDILAPPYDNRAGRRCSYYQLLARPDDSLWAQPISFDDDGLFIDRSFADGTFIS